IFDDQKVTLFEGTNPYFKLSDDHNVVLTGRVIKTGNVPYYALNISLISTKTDRLTRDIYRRDGDGVCAEVEVMTVDKPPLFLKGYLTGFRPLQGGATLPVQYTIVVEKR